MNDDFDMQLYNVTALLGTTNHQLRILDDTINKNTKIIVEALNKNSKSSTFLAWVGVGIGGIGLLATIIFGIIPLLQII